MVATIADAKQYISQGTKHKLNVRDTFAQSLGNYATNVAAIPGIDVNTGKLADKSHEAIEAVTDQIKKLEKTLPEVHEHAKEAFQDRLEALHKQRDKLVDTHQELFSDILHANNKAVEQLVDLRTDTLKELGEHLKSESDELSKLVQKNTNKAGEIQFFTWKNHAIDSHEAVNTALTDMGERYSALEKQIETHLGEKFNFHTKVGKKVSEAAIGIEKSTGQKLLSGAQAEVSTASTLEKGAATAEKAVGASKGTRVAYGVAAAGLGVDGARRVFNPDESTSVGVIELSAAAFSGWKSLGRQVANVASHAHLGA